MQTRFIVLMLTGAILLAGTACVLMTNNTPAIALSSAIQPVHSVDAGIAQLQEIQDNLQAPGEILEAYEV